MWTLNYTMISHTESCWLIPPYPGSNYPSLISTTTRNLPLWGPPVLCIPSLTPPLSSKTLSICLPFMVSKLTLLFLFKKRLLLLVLFFDNPRDIKLEYPASLHTERCWPGSHSSMLPRGWSMLGLSLWAGSWERCPQPPAAKVIPLLLCHHVLLSPSRHQDL